MSNDFNNAYPNFTAMKDGRYLAVKRFVEDATITTFEEIFPTYFPKTKLGKEIGRGHSERMDEFIEKVDRIQVHVIDKIADVFDLDAGLVFKIIHNQYLQKIKPTSNTKNTNKKRNTITKTTKTKTTKASKNNKTTKHKKAKNQ